MNVLLDVDKVKVDLNVKREKWTSVFIWACSSLNPERYWDLWSSFLLREGCRW